MHIQVSLLTDYIRDLGWPRHILGFRNHRPTNALGEDLPFWLNAHVCCAPLRYSILHPNISIWLKPLYIYIRSHKYPTNCWILSSYPTIIGVIAIIVWYNDSYDPIYSIYQLSSYTVGCPPIFVALHMLSTAESHARLRRPTSERILKNWSGLPQNNWEIELIEPGHLDTFSIHIG
jgi:hypothetical protein